MLVQEQRIQQHSYLRLFINFDIDTHEKIKVGQPKADRLFLLSSGYEDPVENNTIHLLCLCFPALCADHAFSVPLCTHSIGIWEN